MARVEGTRRGDGEYLPLVLVTIVLTDADPEPLATTVPALIDSGADKTTIPAELLDGSGIVFESLPSDGSASRGVGGKAETRVVAGTIVYDDVTFVDGDVQVIQRGALPGVVLGRSDFMSWFKVDFEWHKSPPLFHVKLPKQLQSQA